MRGTRACAVAAALLLPAAGPGRADAEFDAHLVWPWPAWWPGGLSGLVVEPDGSGFVAISDRGALVRAEMMRDGEGRLIGVGPVQVEELVAPRSTWGPYYSDGEGLARTAEGDLVLAYEGWARITLHDASGAYLRSLPEPPAFEALPLNDGLEAVAVLPDGRIVTVPESWPEDPARRPVFVTSDVSGTAWHVAGWLGVSEGYDPVGLDADGQGRLYLLERSFSWWHGFSSRVRRFELSGAGVSEEEVLLETPQGQFGNLEGISLWTRSDGTLVASLIADHDLQPFLQRGIVEFRLTD